MDREPSIWPRRRSIILAGLSAGLAAGIFIVDTIAPLDLALSVLYVAVVLIAASGLRWGGVLLLALGCMVLAVTSHILARQGAPSTVAQINLGIGLIAIAVSAYFGWRNQVSRRALRERADLLDAAHDAIFIRDLDDAITYWNKGAQERYGWTSAQALGKVSHALLRTEFPAPLATIKAELLRTGRWEGELVHTARDGARVVVLSRWSLQADERGRPVATLETNNDLTERKRSQQALDRAQAELAHVNRVSTLGELAASIAHEVSQPLTAIVTNVRAATRWLERTPADLGEVRQGLAQIASDGKRAGEILGRIRAFVKKAPLHREPVDINQAVLEVVALTRDAVERNGIALQTKLEQGLAPVIGDRVQLQQVLLNFILNAVDATSGLDADRRKVVVSTASDANGIVVAVRDRGVGIEADRADELFKPFYTTKASGMGMGLSICRSIVEAHGGEARATRNADVGATFQFTLPATASVRAANDRSAASGG